ncbi:3-isopropylmalate dehydratase small subunit [Thalassoglobus neptunius]|uniref:3-isopropylmalate dehydratase n=1 Tax=Thalassoglobus neptunius TaxID=1938619 RepID=A0A5C5WLM3_9PLAN|nr:3-isopropylmalate dehydratase small subunit [Thalassoglobus neptunius]TWT51527.1 3-isopropylmalate dehydratase small subunit [Thalassoglobus neptunius]
MQVIETVTGPGMPLLLDDIDTDRIIPARFLRCVSFEGIGEHAFKDDREQDESHPFNHEAHQEGKILISGRNFGCGSSREHAPQSLMRWGIEAIVAESFAEIFFGNCTSLGIPAVTASRSELERIAAAVSANPKLELELNLPKNELTFGEEVISVEMPQSAHEALTTGKWDFLAQLLDRHPSIKEKLESLPYVKEFVEH